MLFLGIGEAGAWFRTQTQPIRAFSAIFQQKRLVSYAVV